MEFSGKSMRAMGVEGGKLAPLTLPIPQPGTGELLLKVAYAGVNRADLLQVAGSYMPPNDASPLPGLEVSGHIAAMGEAVVGWSVGEPVCALLNGGGYAEYVTVASTQVLPIPNSASLAQAASLPEGTATAVMALVYEAEMKSKERVLLHGGASGTGVLIAQVAHAWGAEVYATAGGSEKCALLESLGIQTIDHTRETFTVKVMQATQDEGVDIVIDILGGPHVNQHLQLLRTNGRLVFLALMENSLAESVKLGRVLMKHLRISGITLRNRTAEEKAKIIDSVRHHVWPHLTTGLIKPVVDQVFPLEEAEKAHLRMQERLHLGKILLEVAPEPSQ